MRKKLIRDSGLNECLWLVKNGVPFDVAFSLPADERFAYSVIFGKFEGGKFDESEMRFTRQD